MPAKTEKPIDPAEAAVRLARELESRNIEYAIGGALALGYWARPRGTVDVDLTLFFSKQQASEAIRVLQQIGCDIIAARALASLREHGFCRATFASRRVDVFIQSNPFYEQAKVRRQRVYLEDQQVMILDAESLAVFKLMFFRPQDFVDVRNMLKFQGTAFDRQWVRQQLLEIVGPRDPRVAEWDKLVSDFEHESH
jgi:nucleotidyltransferase AbiEii toxin of type IV toxin-antitoxin system